MCSVFGLSNAFENSWIFCVLCSYGYNSVFLINFSFCGWFFFQYQGYWMIVANFTIIIRKRLHISSPNFYKEDFGDMFDVLVEMHHDIIIAL